ncbi:MAG: DUF971 domain-containing protein [Edaphobacter sp.]
MSHEGIRFGSKGEAEAEEEGDRSDASTNPAKVRVNKTLGTGMEIDWQDGHKSSWSFTWLRDACPCATCHEERNASGREPGEPRPKPEVQAPVQAAPAAPVVGRVVTQWKAPGLAARAAAVAGSVQPVKVTQVGRYAIKFKWSDGHETGIYSWNYLRSVCQCEECKAKASRRS